MGEERDRLIDAVARVDSTGGGIFVYAGLEAAWKELKEAETGQRHVILFSDAADSEEPGEYQTLLAEMVKEKTTVSVIGMGTPADVDAKLLEDIALRGNGRIFFTENAAELPGLFAQETVTVARSAFIDEPTSLKPTAGWLEIAERPLDWLSSADGYNLSYLRPEATASALTTDEYEAPLVAHWQRGLGRVAAVCFPLAGPHSERSRAWPQYGDFAQTLARWLSGDEVPAGVAVRTKVDGTELSIELLYGKDWEERIARGSPKVVVGEGDQIRDVPWRRLGPGRYATAVSLPLDRHVRGAIQIGEHVLPFGPLNAGASVEWDFDAARIRELRALSLASGGSERLDLEEVWSAPRPIAFRDVSSFFALAFLLLLLLEALSERTGFRIPELALPRLRREKPIALPIEEIDEPEIEAPAPDDDRRRRRFARAKRK